ncbi:50S ribosomal protein L25/general stress protein Ctc [Desulfosoma caldarium]|uniref:Large ribosomal subunit protein bL25 n=1 Tax=Desulfosoma caldarium TaxID=610254 RepID=A0A3N1UNJ5_9BACT|nr:50S ribosomal protein L25/general stress protein Ctc [Desulfosoma caldarium]ROQ90969.1 LSU ribosomal protein L25P [Desulfosoma caldarium]
MAMLELSAKVRTQTGKGPARRLRQQEWIPAVCYGPKTSPLPLSVPLNQLLKCLKAMGEETRLIPLVVDDGAQRTTKKVLVREVQVHPYKRRIIHVDFHEVALDEPMTLDVPVELVGTPVGIAEGGVLNQVRYSLSVRCLPTEIPEKITLDVSHLRIGESLHISDIRGNYPFEILDDDSYTVVTVATPESEEAPEVSESPTEDGEGVTEA